MLPGGGEGVRAAVPRGGASRRRGRGNRGGGRRASAHLAFAAPGAARHCRRSARRALVRRYPVDLPQPLPGKACAQELVHRRGAPPRRRPVWRARSVSRPCALPAPAASMSTPPTRRCAPPTSGIGVRVQSQRSQHANKRLAILLIARRLADQASSAADALRAERRRATVGSVAARLAGYSAASVSSRPERLSRRALPCAASLALRPACARQRACGCSAPPRPGRRPWRSRRSPSAHGLRRLRRSAPCRPR